MHKPALIVRPLAVAVSLALLHIGAAWAQADAAKANDADGLKLDQIVVTGTNGAKAKMQQSVSISTLDGEQVQKSGAASAAEVLRSVPGIRSESSGGESNANMTVRGLPISTGGSRYLQLQEDGLPVLQIGDLNFLTADSYVRIDNVLDRVEAIRGGSSSTLATNAPGGIVNFISKTGLEQGGVASLSLGTHEFRRYEFGYGGNLGPKTRFYLGGHYRTGNGARNGGTPVEEGGQIRGNITQQLDGGYVRLSFKHLDDRAPTYLPLPVNTDKAGNISPTAGFDPRTGSFHSPYWVPDVTLTSTNGKVSNNVNDGFSVTSDAVGVEAEFNLAAGLKVQEKFRTAHNGGRFLGIFSGGGTHPALAGTTYASGPNVGKSYTGEATTPVVFNTSLDNLSLTANDLRVSKSFGDAATGQVSVTGGLYASTQRVAMTWNFNQYTTTATGDKPVLLNEPGVVNGSAGFGGCCMRFNDSTYTTTSPYAIVGYEAGPLNVDASVRFDHQKATGNFNDTGWNTLAPKLANKGVAYDPAKMQAMDYSVNYTSTSFGANYQFTKDAAAFGRYSRGVSLPGDRISIGPGANADGSVVNNVDGSKPIPLNKVHQLEGGLKWRGAGLSVFATLFWAKTQESNIDITKQPAVLTANDYDAKGLELELGYRIGALRIEFADEGFGSRDSCNVKRLDGVPVRFGLSGLALRQRCTRAPQLLEALRGLLDQAHRMPLMPRAPPSMRAP
jgi:outer membrane receptor protein involved in Fe transport